MRIKVDNLYVPETQIRGKGHIKIPDDWLPPARIAADIVGVVHLHPGLHYQSGITFSSIDTGIGGLNERWPMSMVIGRTSNPKDLEGYVLGIGYEIRGRCTLPCGALGTIDYFLHPAVDGVPDPKWPFQQEVIEPEIMKEGIEPTAGVAINAKHEDLGDCLRYTEGPKSSKYELERHASCGLIETKTWLRPKAFGATGEGIIHLLPEILSEVKPSKKDYTYDGRECYRSYSDLREDYLLPGWSEV